MHRRFAVDIQGSFEERRIMANLLRVNFFNTLESFGWCIAAAGTSRTPSDVLQGIQTDLVVENDSCLGRGEYANFLMAKKGRLKGACSHVLTRLLFDQVAHASTQSDYSS
jgi:hypothetical protein